MANSSIQLGGVQAPTQERPRSGRLRTSQPCQYQILLDMIRTTESDTGQALHSVGFTSAKRREGVTTVACNLALRAACEGLRVLLVDANWSRPSLQRIFQLSQSPGLSDLIAGHQVNPDCIHHLSSRPFKSLPTALKNSFRRNLSVSRSARSRESFETPRLSVLTIGSTKVGPRNSFPMEVHRERLLANIYADFDLVIFDLPTVNELAQCPITASRLDGVIFVLEVESTSDLAAQKSLQLLRLRGSHILGVALNKCRRRWFRGVDENLGG